MPPGGWDRPAVPGSAPVAQRGELSGWWPRAGAAVIDFLILFVPGAILFVLIVGSAIGLSGDNEDVATGAVIGAFLLFGLAFLVVWLLYSPLLMMRQGEHNGQTWGRQVLGIRVVRDNGQPMDFWWSAFREILIKGVAVGIASSIVPFIPWLLDYLWPLWDDQNRALHDMAASTHVYRA
jgi:uncharacterized RDD family membrane protein YckC